MEFGHNREEIDQINNLDNIKSIAYDDMAAQYIFNRLWSVHPSVIPTLSPPQQQLMNISHLATEDERNAAQRHDSKEPADNWGYRDHLHWKTS